MLLIAMILQCLGYLVNMLCSQPLEKRRHWVDLNCILSVLKGDL